MVPETQRAAMRADFALIAQERRMSQDWTENDVRAMHRQIKSAVDSGDDEAAAAWADYLASQAAALRARAQACREAEARIRAQRAAEREREEGRAA